VSSVKADPLSGTHTVGPIGALLGDRFRIDRLIGNGGMASVYQATDVALGRTVAVKLFRLDSTDAAGPERQSGEVTVLASLNHFALVTLFDAGTAAIDGVQRTFIVMEFVDGTDLRARIAGGPLPPAEVAEIGADLAEALHYVHARGIIHRDIKPANVLLAPSAFPGRTSHAKLADFGIARLLDSTRLTATGGLIGTATYLSPEQALGAPIGPPSDVYSLGLVLLECLTGERAFPGTAVESAMARLQRQPSIPGELGPEWNTVLSAMTAREPSDRLLPELAAGALRRIVEVEASRAAGAAPPVHANAVAVDTALTAPTGQTGATGATRRYPAGVPATGTQRLDPTATQRLDATAATERYPARVPATTTTTQRLDPAGATAPTAPNAPNAPNGFGVPTEGATPTTVDGPARASAVGALHPVPIRRTRRAAGIAAAVLAAVILVIVAIVLAVRPPEPANAPPPTYPAVAGTLGDHLRQLQESVTP
jgi:eukaryotic-like serine/threonine-protein kinase